MRIREETVTIDTAVVTGARRSNDWQTAARNGGMLPFRSYGYTVEVARETFDVWSVNQCYGVGDRVGVLFRGKKCELLYDGVFYTAKPFCLKNADIADFFEQPTERLANIPMLRYKKKPFQSEKKRISALSDSDPIAAEALIIRRKHRGEWQLSGLFRLRYELTLLVKTERGYFVTGIRGTDRPSKIEGGTQYEQTFTFSTGERIPVLYRRGNPADIAIDYARLVPFSFEPKQRIEPDD